jgi:hypothetical protein
MNRFLKTDQKEFIRDRTSTAILNVDKEGLLAYKKNRDRISKNENLIEDVAELKKEFSEIKQLLIQLVNK